MCDPVTLFGASAAGIAGGGAAVGGIQTIGLLGANGVFAPLSGSIATGIGSAFSGMGAGGAFNLFSLGSSLYGTAQSTAVQQANLEYQAQMQESKSPSRLNLVPKIQSDEEAEENDARSNMATVKTQKARSDVCDDIADVVSFYPGLAVTYITLVSLR